MHGAEYDELTEAVENYKDKFESVKIAEPLLGEVGADETAINEDKAAVAEAITAEAVKTAGFDSLDAAKEEGTAFVFMGHGTSHTAKISYSQMQTQMEQLGYENVFIGTVEGEPEDTACEAVIEKLKNAGYKKVILRPLMVLGRASLKHPEYLTVLIHRLQVLVRSMRSSSFMWHIHRLQLMQNK